jgi:hypothetical protein
LAGKVNRNGPGVKHGRGGDGDLAAADGELDYIGKLLLVHGDPNVSRLMVWE